MQQKMWNMAMMAGVALLATACGETKLMARTLPDETKVIDGPSLAVPPSFELRPPREAADYEAVLGGRKMAEARGLITGVSGTVTVSESAALDGADALLIKQTGVAVDPNVRADLEKAEVVEEGQEKKGLLKRWFDRNKSEE
ncbi:MAG: DUF3035 domain-containing protein [Proteobacteria bacterium]|nr:DUF3035 domain-containing protein [Pseudomonadota bacterium]